MIGKNLDRAALVEKTFLNLVSQMGQIQGSSGIASGTKFMENAGALAVKAVDKLIEEYNGPKHE